MPDNPMLWIISPTGAVETFFPCAQGAEPAVPPGYVLSRAAPAPAAAAASIRVITADAFLHRVSASEWAALIVDPEIGYAWEAAKLIGRVNLDSPVIGPLLARGVEIGAIAAARVAELMRDGDASEAA